MRVHATGRKLYIVQPAGLKRVTLGRVGTETIEDRRREAAVVIDRIKRGEDPKPSKPPPPPTVADLSELVLENYVEARCKPSTARNYRVSIRNHILPALGTKALRDVGSEDLTALHHQLRATPAAANQAIWVLSKMLSLGESWGMVPPVGKAEWTGGKANPRFAVTSLSPVDARCRRLYERLCCARGEMENRIEECQLNLFADRTSARSMRANQLRLWFASMAYVLLCALRRIGLAHTRFARASCGSIRLKLLKIAALVRIGVRRIKLAMASGCPYQREFQTAHARLSAAAA